MAYTEEAAIKSLQRKGVHFKNNEIDLSDARELGNGSLGKLDFLVNYCRYVIRFDSYGAIGTADISHIYLYSPSTIGEPATHKKFGRKMRRAMNRLEASMSAFNRNKAVHDHTKPGTLQCR